MEKINVRRKFLKGFGLLSAVCAGASVYNMEQASSVVGIRSPDDSNIVPPVDISHLAPLGKTNLTLSADNEPPPPVVHNIIPGVATTYTIDSISYSPMMYVGASVADSNKNNVTMSVGKDNRLWVKVDDKWRRVALEG